MNYCIDNESLWDLEQIVSVNLQLMKWRYLSATAAPAIPDRWRIRRKEKIAMVNKVNSDKIAAAAVPGVLRFWQTVAVALLVSAEMVVSVAPFAAAAAGDEAAVDAAASNGSDFVTAAGDAAAVGSGSSDSAGGTAASEAAEP